MLSFVLGHHLHARGKDLSQTPRACWDPGKAEDNASAFSSDPSTDFSKTLQICLCIQHTLGYNWMPSSQMGCPGVSTDSSRPPISCFTNQSHVLWVSRPQLQNRTKGHQENPESKNTVKRGRLLLYAFFFSRKKRKRDGLSKLKPGSPGKSLSKGCEGGGPGVCKPSREETSVSAKTPLGVTKDPGFPAE